MLEAPDVAAIPGMTVSLSDGFSLLLEIASELSLCCSGVSLLLMSDELEAI